MLGKDYTTELQLQHNTDLCYEKRERKMSSRMYPELWPHLPSVLPFSTQEAFPKMHAGADPKIGKQSLEHETYFSHSILEM